MSILSSVLDVHLAAPAPRVRDRQQRSDLPPGSHLLPRRGVPLRATPRSFFRWLRASASLAGRSQRSSFGVRADTPSTRQTARAPMPFASLFLSDGADRDALNVARRSRALDALARTTAAVQAAHFVGEGAPNNGARGVLRGDPQ